MSSLTLPAAAILVALHICNSCSQRDSAEDPATFAVPGSDLILTIERRSSHAYLAEYSRTMVLRSARQSVASVSLFDDSGGYSRANLYKRGDSAYVVRDAEASYVIDIGRKEIARDSTRRSPEQLVFVGSFDVDAGKRWRFIPAAERAELPTEFQGGS